MTRTFNWEDEYVARIRKWQQATFAYGTADCCVFVADVVRAITGVNYFEEWAGLYTDSESAAQLIRDKGFDSLRDVLISYFGQPVPSCQAFRGDIVFGDLGLDAPQIGICMGKWSVSWDDETSTIQQFPTLTLPEAFHV